MLLVGWTSGGCYRRCVGGVSWPLGRPFNCKPLLCDSDGGGKWAAWARRRSLGLTMRGLRRHSTSLGRGERRADEESRKITVLDPACRAFARSLEGCSCRPTTHGLAFSSLATRSTGAVRGPWGHRKPSSSISKHRDHRNLTSRRERLRSVRVRDAEKLASNLPSHALESRRDGGDLQPAGSPMFAAGGRDGSMDARHHVWVL